MRCSKRHAFTLIEIMIVVVIIGLMAGVVTLATTGYLERAKKERARSDIATYSTALDSYYLQKVAGLYNAAGKLEELKEFAAAVRKEAPLPVDPWT